MWYFARDHSINVLAANDSLLIGSYSLELIASRIESLYWKLSASSVDYQYISDGKIFLELGYNVKNKSIPKHE